MKQNKETTEFNGKRKKKKEKIHIDRVQRQTKKNNTKMNEGTETYRFNEVTEKENKGNKNGELERYKGL